MVWTGSIWLSGGLLWTVMNLRVPQNAGNILSGCIIGGFSEGLSPVSKQASKEGVPQ
jgi:hypothetical protein